MYHGERFNAYSHWLGAILSLLGLVYLVILSAEQGEPYKIVSASIYGASLLLLYTFSALYHSIRNPRSKKLLQKFDHLAIYLLIAGSYTPFSLVTLQGAWGWSLFGAIWGLALIGMTQELLWAKGARVLSLIIYVLMGWLALVAIVPLAHALPRAALTLLFAGGLCYSFGVYWYVNDEKIKHGHGIWHLFVLAGSVLHYVCISRWVIAP